MLTGRARGEEGGRNYAVRKDLLLPKDKGSFVEPEPRSRGRKSINLIFFGLNTVYRLFLSCSCLLLVVLRYSTLAP